MMLSYKNKHQFSHTGTMYNVNQFLMTLYNESHHILNHSSGIYFWLIRTLYKLHPLTMIHLVINFSIAECVTENSCYLEIVHTIKPPSSLHAFVIVQTKAC